MSTSYVLLFSSVRCVSTWSESKDPTNLTRVRKGPTQSQNRAIASPNRSHNPTEPPHINSTEPLHRTPQTQNLTELHRTALQDSTELNRTAQQNFTESPQNCFTVPQNRFSRTPPARATWFSSAQNRFSTVGSARTCSRNEVLLGHWFQRGFDRVNLHRPTRCSKPASDISFRNASMSAGPHRPHSRGLHSFPIQLNLSSSVHRMTRLSS